MGAGNLRFACLLSAFEKTHALAYIKTEKKKRLPTNEMTVLDLIGLFLKKEKAFA
jgi:hypothetical protein